MLSDGIMNEGRLLVLNTFTLNVKKVHPNIATEYWNHHQKEKRGIKPNGVLLFFNAIHLVLKGVKNGLNKPVC